MTYSQSLHSMGMSFFLLERAMVGAEARRLSFVFADLKMKELPV